MLMDNDFNFNETLYFVRYYLRF